MDDAHWQLAAFDPITLIDEAYGGEHA
jgi:hypothetical protein